LTARTQGGLFLIGFLLVEIQKFGKELALFVEFLLLAMDGLWIGSRSRR
jgi:hypothetical protein